MKSMSLKPILITTLFMSHASLCLAQSTTPPVLDAGSINQRSSTQINDEYESKKEERREDRKRKKTESLSAIKNFLKMNYSIPHTKLPHLRNLTESELNKKNLISCVDKIITHHSGGYEAPMIAQKLLLQAMDNNSWSNQQGQIDDAEKSCEKIYTKLLWYKNKAIVARKYLEAADAISVNNAAENKAKKLISNLIAENQASQCEVTNYEVEGGFVIGAAIGMNHIKCLMRNGKIRNYYGPSLEILLGSFGAALSLKKNDNCSTAEPIESLSDPHSDIEGVVTNRSIAFNGSALNDEDRTQKSFNLGLTYSFTRGSVGIELRLFDSKRQWPMLIDQLN